MYTTMGPKDKNYISDTILPRRGPITRAMAWRLQED